MKKRSERIVKQALALDTFDKGKSGKLCVAAVVLTILSACGSSSSDPNPAGDDTEQVPPNNGAEQQTQTPLRELVAGTEILFGQPIDDIPSPVIVGGNSALIWTYNVVDEQLSNDFFEAPLSHQLVWQRYSSLIPLEYRESLSEVSFLSNSNSFCTQISAGVSSQGFGRTAPGGERTSLEVCESVASEYFNASMPAAQPVILFNYSSIWIHEPAHVIEAKYTVDLEVPSGEFYDTHLFGAEFPVGLHVTKDSVVGQFYA